MNVFVLVVLGDGNTAESSLHLSRADAERAVAEQIMNHMLTTSVLDLSGVLSAMDDAYTKADYPGVVRFYERIKRRKVVFIQEATLPLALPV